MAHVDGSLTLWVNGVDLQDVGAAYGLRFVVEDMSGPVGLAPLVDAVDIAGGVGAVETSERASYASRDFLASLRVYGSTVEDVARAFRILRRVMNTGTDVTLRTDLDVAYEAVGRFANDAEVYDQLGIFSGRLDVTFRLNDPLWYARTPTTRVIRAGERVRLPVGTAPSDVSALIFGPSSAPTSLIYRDARGTIVTQFVLNVGLAADEFARVRGDLATISVVSGGVEGTVADGLALLDATAEWPTIDPADALVDPLAIDTGTLWPTLEVSDLAGTATALVSYTEAIA